MAELSQTLMRGNDGSLMYSENERPAQNTLENGTRQQSNSGAFQDRQRSQTLNSGHYLHDPAKLNSSSESSVLIDYLKEYTKGLGGQNMVVSSSRGQIPMPISLPSAEARVYELNRE